jgi:hypothetical protein
VRISNLAGDKYTNRRTDILLAISRTSNFQSLSNHQLINCKSHHRQLVAALFIIAASGVLHSCSKRDSPPKGNPPELQAQPAMVEVGIAEVPIGKVVDWESEVDNPKADGWESEVFVAEAKAQLKKLGEFLAASELADARAIAKFVVEPSSFERVDPVRQRVYERAGIVVDRGTSNTESLPAPIPAGAKERRTEFKIFKVLPGEDGFSTHQYVALSWKTGEEIVEQHATWVIDWQRESNGTLPIIKKLVVGDFEQVTTKLAGGRAMFSDCTESVLGANPSYREQLLYGLNHWHERLPSLKILNGFGTPGLALGDVNGDGLDDLYLCQYPGLPNRLFLQNPDGTLRDASAEWAVDWLEDSRSALIVDLDNDGDRDLALSILGHVVLASNRENRRFEIELVLPVSESTASLAAADYDRDGRLDLYVCGYAPETTSPQAAPAAGGSGSDRFVFHDANDSVANFLFRNETTDAGAWKFTDVTVESGLDVNNRRWSFAATWEDYDNDGDPDLYVANDYGRNNLFRNDTRGEGGPKFVDVAAAAGAEDSASGMSVSWGDYDRDGFLDLYVANMFSAAGSRITSQSKFKPDLPGDLRRRYQHFARGNTLLRNLGDAGFEDVSVAAGVTLGRWAWGSNFVDLNNDGWEDLVVANGNLTADDDTGDL